MWSAHKPPAAQSSRSVPLAALSVMSSKFLPHTISVDARIFRRTLHFSRTCRSCSDRTDPVARQRSWSLRMMTVMHSNKLAGSCCVATTDIEQGSVGRMPTSVEKISAVEDMILVRGIHTAKLLANLRVVTNNEPRGHQAAQLTA